MKFGRDVFEFIDRLGRLSTIGAVVDATERMLGRYGFAHFSFSGIPYSSDSMPGIVIAHRIPAELFKLYVERRYADIDPSMRHLRRTTEPFKWLDVPYNSEREPRATELMALVADFGLSQGFFVPIPSPAGTFGSIRVYLLEPGDGKKGQRHVRQENVVGGISQCFLIKL